MKRLIISLCTLLAVTSTMASAATTAPVEIDVSGSGTVTMAPTVATVSGTVTTNADVATDAVSQNNGTYDRVVAAVQKLGVSRSDVALSFYNVNYVPKPKNAPQQPGGFQQTGFTVSRGFTVKVRDLSKAGAVVDAATGAGATDINGVSFGLADDGPARLEATGKAVSDARTKAEALAQAAHLHIVGIRRISQGTPGIRPFPMMRAAVMEAGPANPTQFETSGVTVSVDVEVVFTAAP